MQNRLYKTKEWLLFCTPLEPLDAYSIGHPTCLALTPCVLNLTLGIQFFMGGKVIENRLRNKGEYGNPRDRIS
jgi:hypothetical protein